jgi:glutathione S-transferase
MDPALYWYSICTVALFLKMLALSSYQGFHRISTLTFTNPEDAGAVGRQPAAEELPQVRRAARAWLNDLENLPIFFALGIAYVLLGASPAAAPWLFLTFTIARIIHTLMYLLGHQPWRTIAYGVGIGCLLGMSGTILAAVL